MWKQVAFAALSTTVMMAVGVLLGSAIGWWWEWCLTNIDRSPMRDIAALAPLWVAAVLATAALSIAAVRIGRQS